MFPDFPNSMKGLTTLLNFDLRDFLRTDSTKSRTQKLESVAVFGAGAWGTALAIAFARAGLKVTLWGRNEPQMLAMAKTRKNRKYIGDITLPQNIIPTHSIDTALADADAVFLVVPSKALPLVSLSICDRIAEGTPVVSCTKGLDPERNQLLTKTITDNIPHAEPMFLSGPSFAAEVAAGLPTQVVLAGDMTTALLMSSRLSTPTFQVEPVEDLIGAQIGGLMKNIFAIACGLADGLGHGSNTRAAIMARGLQEAASLAEAMGGSATTLLGVAGAGDLALTCTDPQSRNYSFGRSLADPAFSTQSKTFEGVSSVLNACKLISDFELDAPISATVCQIVNGEIAPDQLIPSLFKSNAPERVDELMAS